MKSSRYAPVLGMVFISVICLSSFGSLQAAGDSESWSTPSDGNDTARLESERIMDLNRRATTDMNGTFSTPFGESLGTNPHPSFRARLRNRIHRLVISERRDWHRRAIGLDTRLSAIARNHSRDMSMNDFIAHTNQKGGTLADRYQSAGYSCQIPIRDDTKPGGGENIFWISIPTKSMTAVASAPRTSSWKCFRRKRAGGTRAANSNCMNVAVSANTGS